MPAPVDVVIGVDAGTTSTKTVAIDESGAIVASGTSELIPTHSPSPGASVQDPAAIWDAFCAACRAAAKSCAAAVRVRALAVAAQSGSVVPVVNGHAGGPRDEALTWMDSRSTPLVESWDASTLDTIRARSGWMPSPGLGLSSICWLIGADDLHAERWASVDDYLLWNLVGSWVTNPSNASGMQLMDVSSKQWSPDLCKIAGVEPSSLSTIRESGESAGSITPAASHATGLPTTIPVIVGGHDQTCAALGLGAADAGSAFLSMGTAWVLTMITDGADAAAIPDGFNLSPHVVPGRWSLSQNLGGLGAVLAAALADASDTIKPDPPSLGDPYFIPTIHDSDRSGWGELTDRIANRDPEMRIRATMEACAFEVRRAVEETSFTVALRELSVVGGGTRSRYLTQQIANTLGVPLVVRADASWPALGAAKLAADSLGWTPDVTAALPSTTVSPEQPPDDTGEQRYIEYRRLTTGTSQ